MWGSSLPHFTEGEAGVPRGPQGQGAELGSKPRSFSSLPACEPSQLQYGPCARPRCTSRGELRPGRSCAVTVCFPAPRTTPFSNARSHRFNPDCWPRVTGAPSVVWTRALSDVCVTGPCFFTSPVCQPRGLRLHRRAGSRFSLQPRVLRAPCSVARAVASSWG